MALSSITYATLSTAIREYITGAANNLGDNYTSMSSVFKSGYSGTKATIAGSGNVYRYSQVSISTYISQVTEDTFTTQFDDYLSLIGVSDVLYTEIPADNFYAFVKDILVFCYAHLKLAASMYATTGILVYDSTASTYDASEQLDTVIDNCKLCEADDIPSFINILITLLNSSVRTQLCKYTMTLS